MSKKDYMFEQVKNYIESNQTQTEFCDDKEYSYDSFSYWIKQYRLCIGEVPKLKSQPSFTEIKHGSNVGNIPRKVLELTTPSGIHINVYE